MPHNHADGMKANRYPILFLLLAVAVSSRFVNIGTQGILVDETWVVPSSFAHFEDSSIFPKLFTYEPFLALSPARQELVRKVYDAHPLFQVVALHAVSDLHPPLFFCLNYYWSRLFGYDVGTIRTPASLYFLLTVFLLFYFMKRQAVPFSAMVIVLSLVVLSPLYLHFSNFARPYTLLMLLSLLSWYLSYRLIETDFKKRYIVAYILAATACLYTHYFGLLVVAAQALYLMLESIIVRKPANLWKAVAIGVAEVVFFLPAVAIIILKTKLSSSTGSPPPLFGYMSPKALWELLLSFGFAYSRSTLYSSWNVVVSVLTAILCLGGLYDLWKKRNVQASRFWLAYFVLSVILVVVFITWKPLFTVRNCLILLIPYLVVAGFGLSSVRNKVCRYAVASIVGCTGLFFVFHGLIQGNTQGPGAMEDWRSAGAYVRSVETQLPVYVYHHSYLDALGYYVQDPARLKGFPEGQMREGPDERSYVLIIVKSAAASVDIRKKIAVELPYLLETNRYKVTSLADFPHIFLYRVEKLSEVNR